jgi:hypothetical protein
MGTKMAKASKARAAEIFISHDSRDYELAIALKRALRAGLRRSSNIFCSSDIGDIPPGSRWFDEILSQLAKTDACIALITPAAIRNTWVHYETGAAYARQVQTHDRSARLFVTCTAGVEPHTLPGHLQPIQATKISDPKHLEALLREVAKQLNCRASFKQHDISGIAKLAAVQVSHWDKVYPCLVGARQYSSPFSFGQLLDRAENRLFIAGFNLFTLARDEALQTKMLRFLGQPSRVIQVLISDLRKAKDFKAWSVIDPNYLKDLRFAVRRFKALQRRVEREAKGVLEIKVSPFISNSIAAVDPDSPDALLVVTPIVPGKPISGERPHFIVTKREHDAIFGHYWQTYLTLFLRGTKIRGISETRQRKA